MKVRFLGYSLTLGGGFNFTDYFSYLESLGKITLKHSENNRILYVKKIPKTDYFGGLLITIKDHKKFCELQDDDGNLKINIESVGEDADLMEFNFFILNEKTGHGIYQHYHQSCSLNQFGFALKRKYNERRDATINEEIANLPGTATKKQEKEIKQKYKGTFGWQIIVRPDKLEALINELDSISSFEFDFLAMKAPEQEFRAFSGVVTKERRKFSFVRKTSVNYLAKEIAGVIKKLDFTGGKVIGRDIDGIEKIVSIADNPDNFGEYEFDDLVSKLTINVSDFVSSWPIEELLKSAKEHAHIVEG
tara:strand:- start:24 stop:938 length:915 start_codon:yes stop_codon:yes gene_type:complete